MPLTLEERRSAELTAAQQIIDTGKRAGRPLTATERKSAQQHIDAAAQLRVQLDDIAEDEQLRRALGKALGGDQLADPAQLGRFSAKSAARQLADQLLPVGQKAIAPSGSAVAPAGLTIPEPIPLDRPANGLLSVIDSKQVTEPPSVS
ncbi:hypothetical protein [Nocardioides sp. GY 10127]|uniref:hypothetical protein n=1 Tax=Nocardioides sp. GY 10127 TaxID=2569762 RepID=UPI0010A7EE78|nr:hypothetical protein [Nocardioides sp. GY 10127]TIC85538.1 hypothetical protein E8D37_02590 [Nocardioides sp. GY 10127]